MSAIKDQDPDYSSSVTNNEKHQRIYEENARSNTAKKITAIIEKEFSQEISTKEKEVFEIQERLHRASKTLHLLRYVIVTDFYNRKQCQTSQSAEAKQIQIHPAIKRLIGKAPKTYNDLTVSACASTSALSNGSYFMPPSSSSPSLSSTIEGDVSKSEKLVTKDHNSHLDKRNLEIDEEVRPTKIPRYVPPKSGISDTSIPSRGIRHKVRKRIIIGNISKWIPLEWREDAASHKWTMYVRGNKENPDIDDFVGKVRFFLHPSYRPNDVVEVTSAPFCLSRRGWGEFPLRVQLHFKSALNKPMDIIHHLKLDRTYTGLQTLGSETLVDVWIYSDLRYLKRNPIIEKSDQELIDKDVSRRKTFLDDKVEEKPKICGNSFSRLDDFATNSHKVNDSVTKETSNTIIKDEDMVEKEIKEIKFEDSATSIDKLRFNINLDHDYFGSKYLNESREQNLTIKHTFAEATFTDLPADDILKTPFDWKEIKQELSEDNDSIVDRSLEEKPMILESEGIFGTKFEINSGPNSSINKKHDKTCIEHPITNGCNQSSTKNAITSAIKFQSNLQPLKISIPPLFESSGSKRVLVLQNNKTIPVDIMVPRSEELARNTGNDLTRSKRNFTVSRGISVLKKSSGSEGPLQSQNQYGSKTQVGLRLKSSGSILLNMNDNVPALKIAETRNLQNDYPVCPPTLKEGISERRMSNVDNQEESKEVKISKPKVTLGKDKHRLQSRKDLYDEVVRTIEIATISDIQGLLRFIIRRMPIITQDSSDPDYRRLHPYACPSEKEFFSYSVAKRRACEWNRAKTLRSFLKRKLVAEKELWTVKEIMIWARLHGYTPLCPFTTRSMESNGIKNLPDSSTAKTVFTCTEPFAFHKWLQTCPDRLGDLLLDFNPQCTSEPDIINVTEVDDVNVEVEKSTSIQNRIRHTETTENRELADPKFTVLEFEGTLVLLHNFVCETAREIGIKLSSEEIVPNVVYCAASRMIMRAVECFVDDLVRMSLAKAWERCDDNGYPKVVSLDDVQRALLDREEFDIFTNKGLGSKCQSVLLD